MYITIVKRYEYKGLRSSSHAKFNILQNDSMNGEGCEKVRNRKNGERIQAGGSHTVDRPWSLEATNWPIVALFVGSSLIE